MSLFAFSSRVQQHRWCKEDAMMIAAERIFRGSAAECPYLFLYLGEVHQQPIFWTYVQQQSLLYHHVVTEEAIKAPLDLILGLGYYFL